MPVKLVKDDEKLSFEFAGGIFYYKRPPLKIKKRWVNECTDARGNIDFYGLVEKALPYCLIGWEQGAVVDAENKPVTFSMDVVQQMPEEFYNTLSAKLMLSEPDNNGETKNLNSTSTTK